MHASQVHEWIKRDIHSLQGYTAIDQIHKGYSGDMKFVVGKHDKSYLLKCFGLNDMEQKQAEYDVLKQLESLGVKCSYAIEIGRLTGVELGYMVMTYVEGDDASDMLPRYPEEEQYQIGLEAGSQLRLIHQLTADKRMEDWYKRKLAKYRNYVEQYKQCGVRIAGDSRILAFIEEHLHLMKNRPNLFQHDDYHTANLIVRNHAFAGVIDFNRMDWGDPVHEFLKTGFFSAEVSVPFSIGQIRGYHHRNDPSERFWQLYALYVAMCTISSIAWIMKVKPDELSIMMAKVERVIEDHDQFTRMMPRWYDTWKDRLD
ncbi:aminoglycoside phosphotransferase family protein [Paenibacillus harenae]|uniref:aminoglycoside phosphotransferase family protein n=1 Tax=Paenibacillus harenae TaxID=306543 RepID=UPI002790934C|nr:phosphotransferase [Paenibacillus harenae]MDQ0059837.1 aminoglycoside phosphotransferase (APT) family kinase protein [Paenibacillus harenae]